MFKITMKIEYDDGYTMSMQEKFRSGYIMDAESFAALISMFIEANPVLNKKRFESGLTEFFDVVQK
jgi:hypothetical protein